MTLTAKPHRSALQFVREIESRRTEQVLYCKVNTIHKLKEKERLVAEERRNLQRFAVRWHTTINR